jgi:hypothetical protein
MRLHRAQSLSGVRREPPDQSESYVALMNQIDASDETYKHQQEFVSAFSIAIGSSR